MVPSPPERAKQPAGEDDVKTAFRKSPRKPPEKESREYSLGPETVVKLGDRRPGRAGGRNILPKKLHGTFDVRNPGPRQKRFELRGFFPPLGKKPQEISPKLRAKPQRPEKTGYFLPRQAFGRIVRVDEYRRHGKSSEDRHKETPSGETSATISISTGEPSGSSETPTATLECAPPSGNTREKNSEAPSTTLCCSRKPGALAT